ncbi:long-chain fatty acid--CoA ligase [Spiractinospora alimapuensis]|uniref:long-chain fatty acid--CoA ligase n=1 Tax=Spiractinospora alimapuensis TaxID=2820884 RepID=UPI001F1E55D0|nr:long-chain fatty acid--CoA ligase [Spiractinospora alimapuensis]QVQ52231.1 long-chain fatty acid--CoA ligase [Spiractinospora alimapuensis]
MRGTMQDAPLSLSDLVRYGTTVHGGAQLVTWTGDEPRRFTFARAGARAAQLAHALRELGVTGDQRVATLQWNNQEHFEAYLAVPAMGAVLHTINIRLPADQIVFIANHAEDQVLIVDATLLPLVVPILGKLRTVRHLIVCGGDPGEASEVPGVAVHRYEDLIAGRPEEFDWVRGDEHDAAALCYTSGTTGDPKGVAYSHRSIWMHSMQVCMTDGLAIRQSDNVLAIVPMFHVLSWGLPYAALMVGASLLLPDRFLQPAPLVEMIATERPTATAAIPSIWQGVLAELETNPRDVSSLRQVIVGGSACPPALMEASERRHGVPIVHAWGMTETSPLGSVARAPGGVSAEEAWDYRVSQGRLAASVQARLVDDAGDVVPWDGVSVGELEVRGPWIAGSYFGVEAPDRFDDGWLRTGDVGRITEDGFLTLTDRSKDLVKSGGEWISSVELENLVMAHPDVAEAAVIAVPDARWHERPLVTVVVRPEASVDAAELRAFLADRVARWQLPEYWAFVDAVPKTSVGKFDKKRIRAQHREGTLAVEEVR